LDERIGFYEQQLKQHAAKDASARRVQPLEEVGPLSSVPLLEWQQWVRPVSSGAEGSLTAIAAVRRTPEKGRIQKVAPGYTNGLITRLPGESYFAQSGENQVVADTGAASDTSYKGQKKTAKQKIRGQNEPKTRILDAEGIMADPIGTWAALRNQGLVTAESSTHFRIERNFLIALMAKRLASIKFDEAWYLAKYPDVKDGVRRGLVQSGQEHYVLFGYYEHRMPYGILVNEKWYVEAYPDVAEAMKTGVYKSGQAHFELAGFREGRMPYANFQL